MTLNLLLPIKKLPLLLRRRKLQQEETGIDEGTELFGII